VNDNNENENNNSGETGDNGGGSGGGSGNNTNTPTTEPDIDISSVEILNSEIHPNDNIRLNISIINNGNGTCPGTTTMKIFLLPNHEIIYKTIPKLTAHTNYLIQIKESDNFKTTKEGKYKLVIDFENDPEECVYNDHFETELLNDNIYTTFLNIFTDPADLNEYDVDLLIEDIFHSNMGPDQKMLGVVIRNRGNNIFRAQNYQKVRLVFENTTTQSTEIYTFTNEEIGTWETFLVPINESILTEGDNQINVRLEIQDLDPSNNFENFEIKRS